MKPALGVGLFGTVYKARNRESGNSSREKDQKRSLQSKKNSKQPKGINHASWMSILPFVPNPSPDKYKFTGGFEPKEKRHKSADLKKVDRKTEKGTYIDDIVHFQ